MVFQIRCVNNRECSGKPKTVMITDMNYYPVAKYHFDLSGTAFGAMAKRGLNDKLRHAGIIDISFTRYYTLLQYYSYCAHRHGVCSAISTVPH